MVGAAVHADNVSAAARSRTIRTVIAPVPTQEPCRGNFSRFLARTGVLRLVLGLTSPASRTRHRRFIGCLNAHPSEGHDDAALATRSACGDAATPIGRHP